MFSEGKERHQWFEMGHCITLNVDLLTENEV